MFDVTDLQKEYSQILYGKTNLVSSDILVFWIDIAYKLNISLEPFKKAGICTYNSFPPQHPYFIAHDVQVNTKDLIWRRHEVPHKPVQNHTWIEITHCRRPEISGAMWTYYATGSGVSMNVGNTLVTRHRKYAMNYLKSIGLLTKNDDQKNCNSKNYTSIYDSIQVLDGYEYYSREPRHEIIFLRHRECDALSIDMNGLKCGKYPNLFTCEKDHLSRMNSCAWFNNVLSYKFKKFHRENKKNCST